MNNSSNNLPTSQFYNQSDINVPVEVIQTILTTVNFKNYNLSKPQKELLHWHYCLGHLHYLGYPCRTNTAQLSLGGRSTPNEGNKPHGTAYARAATREGESFKLSGTEMAMNIMKVKVSSLFTTND